MKRNILLHPDPRLKKTAEAVADISDDLRALADDMLETMYAAPGIGLAAPQVGLMHRLVVLDCVKEEGEAPRPLVMFNPQIIASSDEMNVYEEGCLSIPEQFADVTRPAEVEVRWMDRDGGEQQEVFTGLWATCAQHEIDHLDGKLFIDYLKPLKRQMITRKMVKLKRELATRMSLRDVVLWPDPWLSVICDPVKHISDDIEKLAQDMLETMYAAPGRGLAAPQVGAACRMFVMDATWKDGERAPQVFINPVVLAASETTSTMSEGCLSIPGVSVDVARPSQVTLQWTALDGSENRARFDGFASACVQHELDHLNGVLTLGRVDAETRARVLTMYQEYSE